MRYTIRYGEHQGTHYFGSKSEMLAIAEFRSVGNHEFSVHVVEVAPSPALFGRVRATYQGGVRIDQTPKRIVRPH
jgi:hypothetical protein